MVLAYVRRRARVQALEAYFLITTLVEEIQPAAFRSAVVQFNDWTTLFHHYRRVFKGVRKDTHLSTCERFYETERTAALQQGKAVEAAFLEDEQTFFRERRPYYNVYPGIIEPLTRVRLNAVPSTCVVPPLSAILVRLPTNSTAIAFEHGGQSYPLLSMLVVRKRSIVMHETFLDIWIDIGETGVYERPVYTLRSFKCREELSVEESIAQGVPHPSRHVGIPIPIEFQKTAVKLVCSLCMLEDDPDVIEPDILSEDELKYQKTKDRKYVERAISRRGRIGWNIGRHLDKSPHWRRAHLATFWTGPGRSTPKLRIRKGAFINRRLVGQIPTGFLDG